MWQERKVQYKSTINSNHPCGSWYQSNISQFYLANRLFGRTFYLPRDLRRGVSEANGWATLNFNRLPSLGSTHSLSSTQRTSLYSIFNASPSQYDFNKTYQSSNLRPWAFRNWPNAAVCRNLSCLVREFISRICDLLHLKNSRHVHGRYSSPRSGRAR
jgi:hypothetical protein